MLTLERQCSRDGKQLHLKMKATSKGKVSEQKGTDSFPTLLLSSVPPAILPGRTYRKFQCWTKENTVLAQASEKLDTEPTNPCTMILYYINTIYIILCLFVLLCNIKMQLSFIQTMYKPAVGC